MKKYILTFLISVLAINLNCQAQTNFLRNNQNSERLQNEQPSAFSIWFDKHIQRYVGFGFGPETGIALFLPKFSFYNFQNRRFFETYFGIEGTMGMIYPVWFSLNGLYGVKKNIFTFDTSLGAWYFPRQTFGSETGAFHSVVGPYFQITLNPKIGIKLGYFWLKAGPSFHLYRNYNHQTLGSIGRIGNMYFNFELLIKLGSR